jgi:hypothetical protein
MNRPLVLPQTNGAPSGGQAGSLATTDRAIAGRIDAENSTAATGVDNLGAGDAATETSSRSRNLNATPAAGTTSC